MGLDELVQNIGTFLPPRKLNKPGESNKSGQQNKFSCMVAESRAATTEDLGSRAMNSILSFHSSISLHNEHDNHDGLGASRLCQQW